MSRLLSSLLPGGGHRHRHKWEVCGALVTSEQTGQDAGESWLDPDQALSGHFQVWPQCYKSFFVGTLTVGNFDKNLEGSKSHVSFDMLVFSYRHSFW